MCGDHFDKQSLEKEIEGSPPHVRGPRIFASCFSHSAGITPACAGTTALNIANCTTRAYHPRMCGDHSKPRPLNRLCRGSPPHVRGPPALQSANRGSSRDHPRMCGDHASVLS